MMFIEKRQALVEIDVPLHLTAHELLFAGDGFGRTGIFTDPAVHAESIYPVIYRVAERKRAIGQNRREAKAGAKLRGNEGAVLSQLSKARLKRCGDHRQFARQRG